jgi:uncharacterized protein (TIGR02145 family)
MRKIATMLTLLCVAAFAQQKGTFTDTRDKKTYKTVKIGEQTWMAENLNYADKSYGKNDSKCYEDKPANCAKYGRLYNWETAVMACPKGWHLPTKEEWDALSVLAGGSNDSNEVAEKKLKAKNGWNNNGNGTDDFGFSAMPGGRGSASGDFAFIGSGGRWWSASNGYYRRMNSSYEGIPWRGTDGSFLFSVRCLKGEPGEEAKSAIARIEEEKKAREEAAKEAIKREAEEKAAIEKAAGTQFNPNIKYGSMTDARDKTTYKTTTIAGLTWLAENLKYNIKDSKCYEDKEHYCKRDGRLYDWEKANKACPSGWHLPNQKEWEMLTAAVGKNEKKLKAKTGWEPNDGTDDYGFSALPGGNRKPSFWAASPDTTIFFYYDYLQYVSSIKANKAVLHSVRCVQGKSPEEAIDAVEKILVESAVGKQFNPKIKYDSMTDARDKTTYKTVKIGNQIWMAENLNYNASGSKCFNDKDYYCKRDGRLYDWATAKTACPAGWHLPTKGEWETLGKTVGGLPASGKKLKSTNGGWVSKFDKNPINGTDDFGFSALLPTNKPIGRDFGCMWWSASEAKRAQDGQVSRIFSDKLDDPLSFDEEKKTYLFSVRCVQGEAPKEVPVAAQPAAQQPAAQQPASQQKQQPANELCSIKFPKSCVSMPASNCKMVGGKVVSKCP